MKISDYSREITLELVRVTEAAALKASRWLGKGDKNAADQAAVDAMRGMLDLVDVQGTVVIGEGEKDRAPMLYIGEKVGGGGIKSPRVDIAVDPLDGTNLTARGLPNAISVMAMGDQGSLKSFPSFYVDKIAVGPAAKGCIDLNDSVKNNLKRVAKAYGCKLTELTAIMLDRPRHSKLVEEVRKTGARIKMISDGDVAGAIATAISNSGVDILFGIGGAPEAVLAAAALKCMGGDMQVRVWPRDDEEKKKIMDLGYSEKDFETIYTIEDLCHGESTMFSATGVSGGDFLQGVLYEGDTATTQSIVMRAKTKTVRYIKAVHNLTIKTVPSLAKSGEIQI